MPSSSGSGPWCNRRISGDACNPCPPHTGRRAAPARRSARHRELRARGPAAGRAAGADRRQRDMPHGHRLARPRDSNAGRADPGARGRRGRGAGRFGRGRVCTRRPRGDLVRVLRPLPGVPPRPPGRVPPPLGSQLRLCAPGREQRLPPIRRARALLRAIIVRIAYGRQPAQPRARFAPPAAQAAGTPRLRPANRGRHRAELP